MKMHRPLIEGVVAVLCSTAAYSASPVPVRTVSDTELGAIFTSPNGFSWSDYGAYVGVFSTYSASFFNPRSIKANFTRFHAFKPSDDTGWNYFPYSALRAYEAREIAAGRPPIFVTATYQGKKRPVFFSWTMQLDSSNRPTAPSSEWEYAVNVGDQRFIDFWLNQYLRPTMWQNMYSVANLWWGLDECGFNLGFYGVLDDDNRFVSGVPWDPPFPQDSSSFGNAVATFFDHLKTVAPDVRTLPLFATMGDPSQFQQIFKNIPGIMHENMYDGQNPSAYLRNARIPDFANLSWFGAQGGVGILRFMIAAGDPVAMQTAFSIYSLIKGPNFFFAPAIDGTGTSISPSSYSDMEAKLGNPISAFQSKDEPGMDAGYRLYWRIYDGGIVYLNWSGKTKAVVIPANRPYFDATGNRVAQVSIPDGAGIFVTVNSYQTMAKPRISPRSGSQVTNPMTVTINSASSFATIRYTLDGSSPNLSSPIYTGPITLAHSATVKACAFQNGYENSAISTAVYTLAGSFPWVQFTTARDSGPAGTAYPVLVLDAIPTSPITVNYTVWQPSGSTTQGTVTFLPGELYRYFPVPASGTINSVVHVAITGLTSAGYAPINQYNYTIH